MAKGKNAAALFEVIHTDKRFGKSKDPAEKLSTPIWWFKGRPRQPAPVDPTTRPIAGPAAAPEAPMFVPPDPTPGADDRADDAHSAPAAHDEPVHDPTLPAAERGGTGASAPRRGRKARLGVDPDRGEISFKLTYTSAIVGTFAIVVVLGLAYLLGRHLSRGPTPVLASTDALRSGPARPGVLELGQGSPAPVANGPAAVSTAKHKSAENTVTPNAGASVRTPPTIAPQPPATHVVDDDGGPRQIGLQYTVVQSWPPQEKDLAEEAVKALKSAGISCTVETGLPYAPGWLCVVGKTGFARTRSSPEYDAYVDRIMQVSDKFAGTRKWKRFDPKPLTWRQTRR